MRLKHNNRGFTLVELIVATAILGIVALSASAFMVAGARTYRSVNQAVRLQTEAQIVMAQLQEYTVDCKTGIAWDGANLYIVNGNEVHVFTYKADELTLSYGKKDIVEKDNPPIASARMADHVTSMAVDLKPGKAEIILTMQRNNKTYNATQVISLRNRPVMAGNWGNLCTEISNLGS